MDSIENEAIVNEEANDVKPSGDAEDDNSSRPHRGNGASPGKIFIGGLARETTSAQFVKHFGEYGEITDSVIMKDRNTGQPRGFGFVTYADSSVVDQVIQDTHTINGKQRTIPKGSISSKDFKTKKIFVGGVPTTMTDDEFKDFFSEFGEVKEHQIMRDQSTGRSRGFGFITFDLEQSVDDLLSKGNKLEMAGTQVEVRKAEPKKPNPPLSQPKRHSNSRPAYDGGFGDAYGGGFGGGSFAAGAYRSGGAYAGRASAYGGYGGGEFGGYGGYGSGVGAYRGDPSLGYSARYGGGLSRGYDIGGGYGGASESYGGYGGSGGAGAGAGPGPGYGAGYDSNTGSGYDSNTGSGYGSNTGGGYGGGNAGSFYGSRGGYGGAGSYGGTGSGRYHPYGR